MRIAIISCILALCSFSSQAFATVTLNGAGATFPYPLYSTWFSTYEKINKEERFNYQPIGSGGGIKQFTDGTIDFGATDMALTDEQIAKLKGDVVHIPTALGAVVVTYNLPQLKKPVQFSGEVLCDVFLGKITNWNDTRLVALNPDLTLPSDKIFVIRRADGSGTTAIFTDYLSKVCPEWKSSVGSGTTLRWPIGLGGKGNDGVTSLIKQMSGSLGYVELIYAEKNKLPTAKIRNRAKQDVLPSIESVTEAAAASLSFMPEDFRVSITNATGANSYPISGFTYLLVHKKMVAEKGVPLVSFLTWALKDGQKINASLSYAPLPPILLKRVIEKVKSIEIK